MNEVNQSKNPSSNPSTFENRNYNRINQTNSISQKSENKSAVQGPKPSAHLIESINSRVRLAERDYKIFEFILEMKFSSRDDLFEKFFKITKDNTEALSQRWCVERITALEKAGYLKLDSTIQVPGFYYIATEKAHEALHLKIQTEKIPKPRKFIEPNVFVHDKLVLRSRLEFELDNPGCRWISDLKLRSGLAALFSLPSTYIPDAIYELSTGEKVAFEFENAPKGRGAYREKISYFAKLIDMKRDEPHMFTRVRFRCVRPDVYKILLEETSLYPGLFSVEMWDSPFAKEGGGRVPIAKVHQGAKENV